jgi:hypothetical protein
MSYEVHLIAKGLEGLFEDPSRGTNILRQMVLRDC